MITWIPGYEMLYSADKEGRIYSHLNKRKELKGSTSKRGYRMVTLCKEGKSTKHQWHRLIALTFIPTTDTTLTVDHRNEDKLDNSVDNLRWCTRQENIKYYATNEERQQLRQALREKRKADKDTLRKELRSKKVSQPKPVVEGTAIYINGTKYISQREATRFLLSQPNVSATEDTVRKELRNLVNGKRNAWTYQGKYYISLSSR